MTPSIAEWLRNPPKAKLVEVWGPDETLYALGVAINGQMIALIDLDEFKQGYAMVLASEVVTNAS